MHTQKLITKSFDEAKTADVVLKSLKEHGDSIAKFKDQVSEDIDDVKTKSQETAQQLIELQQFVAKGAKGGGSVADDDHSSTIIKVEDFQDRLALLRDGSSKSIRVPVKTFHQPRVKAVATNSGFPGQAERDPEWYYALTRPLSVRDLLIVRPTSGNSVDFVKASRSANAGPQFDPANPTLDGEGALKKQIDLQFEAANAKVSTIAAWTAASRQVIDDVEAMQDFINTTLLDAVREEEDRQLLYGSGVGMNLNGLMTQAAPYTRTVVDDGPNATIRRAITQVQLARGTPTGIVVNPVAFEALELETDNQGQYLVTYNVGPDGRTTSWRVAVVPTDAMAEDEFLVGDFVRAARLYDRQAATVLVSLEHQDFFVRNLVAILAEERLTLTVPRPQLLVKGEFPE